MHSFSKCSALLLLMMSFASARATPQEAIDIGKESTWQGEMDLGSTSLRLQFQFTREDAGKYSGNLISLDQGNAVVPLDSLEITDHKVTLAIKKLRLDFVGEFDKALTKLSGTLTQGTGFPLELVRVEVPKNLKHIETWKGTLKSERRTVTLSEMPPDPSTVRARTGTFATCRSAAAHHRPSRRARAPAAAARDLRS